MPPGFREVDSVRGMTETSTAAAVSPARDTGPALLRLMLALTFTTGIVDAIGYLGLDLSLIHI